ncbi:DUF4054 domain-containing protein [Serratia sp. UGAL515B_01]|uniref:DUF4054 domain-containing protein n=1 Tax=Serratia sp. UGAL515B_01 TaxID=2986763 RepID=UPI0029534211|nr:DUF4054 domain-containing protein [Serratia sp. UGAL515B_01]WON76313.1 DUF4054 domain-containing protein [Serratia sp. UGAL515B_01]
MPSQPYNLTLPTETQFRTDFPQFTDVTRYPTAQIARHLALADRLLDEARYGQLYAYVVELFVAHHLTLFADDMRASALGGSSGDNSGVLAAKSVDKVSIRYDNCATLNPQANRWNHTRYGAEFYDFLLLFGAGGQQL